MSTKPAPSDYLPFLEAARGHEANARASGSPVDAELARLMYAEATRLRSEALYPPERCIECGATIHSDEVKCGACGRARQGVKLGTRHVVNLVRFLDGYDFAAADKYRARQQSAATVRARKWKAAHPRLTEGKRHKMGLHAARAIRAALAEGETFEAVAAARGVSVSVVRKIAKGRIWKETT